MPTDLPLFVETPVFTAGEAGVCEYRIPAMVCTNEGTLLAACDARADRPGDAPNNIDLALKRSEDLGETWSVVEILIDDGGQMCAGDPCMLVDRETGAIWIVYDHIYPTMDELRRRDPHRAEGAQAGRQGRVIFLHAIRSDDDGHTWSEPIDLTPQVKRAEWQAAMAAPGTGIQMRDGRLICPGYRRHGQDYTKDGAQVFYSDDHGETWRAGESSGPGGNECQAVELADGRLMLNIRTPRGHGCRTVATSNDGGETWSEPRDDRTLIEPGCQASFIRWTSEADGGDRNRLLFSNPASAERRERMTVRLSYDEGETWPISRLVNADFCAYSCMAALPDGTVGLLYEHKGPDADTPGLEDLIFARINEAWLTGG